MDELTRKSYQLRRDIIEMMYNSKAGHVGGDLSVIDILTVLYFKTMNVAPEKKDDPDRDRFLLSKGHCADALYCVLGERGYYDVDEAIKTFSQFGSRFIGHPNTEVPGIELNSGSLGHGLSVAVGMALAARMNGQSYRTYVVLGDGEMAEGSNYEGMMAAGHYHLDNLCATVDLNRLQISGTTKEVMNSDSLADKFKDSIRSLEGALIRLNFYASINKATHIDINLCAEALQSMVDCSDAKRKVSELNIAWKIFFRKPAAPGKRIPLSAGAGGGRTPLPFLPPFSRILSFLFSSVPSSFLIPKNNRDSRLSV